ncbi:hypothetical protein Clacol_008832 [Clathrus columnatus]|uniref:Uncharacterized protein n=1 Tax=Clathrus columnatus TaxID=1419009 RepID=A0AAV5AIT8_9AGAM|nr:hypothetical protein Clacol_008832 [Clathrus columnatus]
MHTLRILKILKKARRDGMFAGATGGLFAVAGGLSGYLFSQAFLSTYLHQLEGDAFKRAQLQTEHDLPAASKENEQA